MTTLDTNNVVERLRAIETDQQSTLGIPTLINPDGPEAADLIQSLSDRIDVLEPKATSYDHAHEDAVEMGYPSLTEALEHLDELRAVSLTKEGKCD